MKRKEILLITMGVLAVVDIGVGAWYYEATNAVSSSNTQLEVEQETLQNLQLANERLMKQIRSLPKVTTDEQTIPKVADQPGLLQEIQKLAASSGVAVSALTFSGGASAQNEGNSGSSATNSEANGNPDQTTRLGENGLTVQTQIVVTGTSDEVMSFVNGIQLGHRYASVRSVDANSGNNQTTLTLSVDFPYHP